MKIIELLTNDKKEKYLNKMKGCEWKAAKFLCDIILQNKEEEFFGENPKVFLLLFNDEIVSFCTFVNQDEIRNPLLFPWIGFVYTFPKYRGKRNFGKLLNYIIELAKEEKHKRIYVSTSEIELYEKYGFKYLENMYDFTGNSSRIYYIEL